MLLVFIAPFVLPFSFVVGKAIGETENDYNATRFARSGCSSECVFPFTFLGMTHNSCTDADHDQLWCATARDRTGEVTTWVNCDQDCQTGRGGGSFGLSQCVRDCRMLACDVDLDTKVGCNQMFNCAQACKMRDLGLSRNECSRQCRRNGGSGCSPRVGGFEFELCARCNRRGCSKYPSVDECQIGCNNYRDEGCCDALSVSGKYFSNGKYVKTAEQHNGSPIYKHTGNRWCIFYGGHWKIEACDWLTQNDGSRGFGWSNVNAICPGNIGPQWRYYSWSGGSGSGPLDTGIKVECA